MEFLSNIGEERLGDVLTESIDNLAGEIRETLGLYPICKDVDADLLMGHVKEMYALTSKINELKDARKAKDATLADTTKLRVEMRKLGQQLKSVMDEIKGMCQ